MTKRAPIAAEIKAHPSYSEGYLDGFEGEPRKAEQPAQYDVGYDAGSWAAGMLMDTGFERSSDGGFSISLRMGGSDA